MRNHKMSFKNLLTIIFVCTFFLIVSSPASAQSRLPLTVGPARQQLTVNPGDSASFAVKFYNQSDITLNGVVNVADFVVGSNDGAPRIIDDVRLANPRFSASSWINLSLDQISIASNDRAIITGSITVPKDARPGGRYVSVYFEPAIGTPQSVGEGNVQGVAPRIASLLYIRVAGPITENAIISHLFAQSFLEYGPIKVNAEILNRGDYHIRPMGVLSLSNMLGSLTQQVSLREENIFPDASRTYENSIGTKWMVGKYKINLTASYGEKGQVLERSIFVWVFPWKIATVIILAIIILLLLGKNMYKGVVVKEASLEKEIEQERKEIEELKEQLKKKDE